MMECIVYESNTGFTKQYAEMLSEAVGLPALPMVQAVSKIPRSTEIFFLGWVCGGKITGLPVAEKRFIVEEMIFSYCNISLFAIFFSLL